MNPIFQNIMIDVATRRAKEQPSSMKLYKELKELKIEIKSFLKSSFLIGIGTISASFGLKGFLLPNSYIDGGVTGISLLISEISGVSLSVLLIIFNIPFLLLGFSAINKVFTFKSLIAVLLLSFLIFIVPYPAITQDKLLVAVFGGFFIGLGVGLSIRGGAVLDGTEILAVFLTRKSSLTIGDIILIFNIIIFSFAAYVLSIEVALYAILTYFVASKTVDFIIDGIEEYIGVTIISGYSNEIRLTIIEKLGRGCTIYLGQKGYAKRGEELKNVDIVYTVITRLEMTKLKAEIEKIDKDAFIIMSSIKDAKGGMIKKRPLEN